MDRLKTRIKSARNSAGLTQKELAEAIGLSRGAISLWESLKSSELPTVNHLFKVARACNVRADWLLVGSGHNVSQSGIQNNYVPILEFEHAHVFVSDRSSEMPEIMDQSILCPVPHGPRTFALRVVGRSMTSSNPLDVTYPEGLLIYCDPDAINIVTSDSPVIALVNGEAVFKVYVRDGSKEWLKSLNSEYGKLTEPFELLAAVIGSFQKS